MRKVWYDCEDERFWKIYVENDLILSLSTVSASTF